jgi:hypothetical protein
MHIRQLLTFSALLLSSSLAAAPTSSLAQTATPAQIVTAMRNTNLNIDTGLEAIQTRCDIQQKRKVLLEQENARRTPDLNGLNSSKTILLALLDQQNSVLMEKTRILSDLKARISQLQDDIKSSKKTAATHLAELKAQRDTAKTAVLAPAKKLRRLDDAYEALVLAGQATDQGEASYLSTRAELVNTQGQQQATVIEKNRAIADLTALMRLGQTDCLGLSNEELKRLQDELKLKQSSLPTATAEQKAAQVALNGTKKKLRIVQTKIAKLSAIEIPAIPSICAIIDQFTPAD